MSSSLSSIRRRNLSSAQHEAEMTELLERAERLGLRVATARRELEQRQRRERRRQRTGELRHGLGLLAGVYRDRLREDPVSSSPATAVARIHDASEALIRSPNERLLLLGLFVDLNEQ